MRSGTPMARAIPAEQALFAARARESGVTLADEEIGNLFEGYVLLQRLVAELDRPTDILAEPAPVFSPVVIA
jgi:hypothetical protein